MTHIHGQHEMTVRSRRGNISILGILVLVILASCNKTGSKTPTAPVGLRDLTVKEESTTVDSVELTWSRPTGFGTTDGTTPALFGSYVVKVYQGADDSGSEVEGLTLTPSSLDESTVKVRVSGLSSGTQYAFKLVLSNANDSPLSSDSNVVSDTTNQGPGGIIWNEVSVDDNWFSGRSGHAAVVFKNKLWVIGGTDGTNLNDVWSSSDGESWTENIKGVVTTTRFSGREKHAAAVFKNKLWVIGGTDGTNLNDVWSSSDGASWTEETKDVTTTRFSGRSGHAAAVFDGKLWVIGGSDGAYTNDVWSSSDGASWTEVVTNDADATRFSGRYTHAVEVLDGKLWVIGGSDGAYTNDVWSSSDGASWTEVVTNDADAARFSAREKHAAAVFDGKLWVIGGFIGTTRLNDVWSSSDGASWTEVLTNNADAARFSGRYSHAVAVFDNKLWVISGIIDIDILLLPGGITSRNIYINDVWHSP